MMQLQNIDYSAGRKKILTGVSLAIKQGIVTVLLGPNGAGKSSLLRVAAGDALPAAGSVWLQDKPLHAYTAAELAVKRAVLSQHLLVQLPFTCEEMVMMGRYPHFSGAPAETDQQVVLQAMEEMQVAHLAQRLYQTLSGGEQQRVQLARLLAQLYQPPGTPGRAQKLLLLDEPVNGMDCLHQQLALAKARELAAKGYAVLVILHDLNLAAQFGDYLVLLRAGQVLAAGTPYEVLQPSLVREAYGMDVHLLQHDDCDFPVIIPAALIKTKTTIQWT